jgi:chromosome segregation ATPase
MSVVPFSASPDSGAEPGPHAQASDARHQMGALKQALEDAVRQIDALQATLASQEQLEALLKQGRTHLQDLRSRLQQVTAERDRLQTEAIDTKNAHRAEVDDLQRQFQRQISDVRTELQAATAERNRLAAHLEEREAAHKKFAEERSDERSTFKRLLDEATSTQREMTDELNEQRQQIDTLREAATRAQSFAREIMRAHEAILPVAPAKPHE